MTLITFQGKSSCKPARLIALLFIVPCFSALLSHCAHPAHQSQFESREYGALVHFSYSDSTARRVCLAGSFNQWSDQSHCMHRNGNTWSLSIFLPPGRYLYLFVIDSHTRKPDPGAVLSEEDIVGARNSVLIVE